MQILQSIAAMVDRCRRAMLTLKDQCRRDRAALQVHHGPSPGGSGTATDGVTFNRSPNGSRTVDDLQVMQIRQLAGTFSLTHCLFAHEFSLHSQLIVRGTGDDDFWRIIRWLWISSTSSG